jgi:hypothetical protein
MSKIRRLFSLFVISFLPVTVWADSSQKVLPKAPDYSKKSCWLYVEGNPVKTADVFYVHPTTYMDTGDGMNASLNNKKANVGARRAFERQATAFRNSCNIYAPRYRQASIKVLTMSEKERAKYLAVGMKDAVKAFKYYLKHYNKGRPYILASHSQGSQVVRDFLIKHGNLIDKKRLIAVYAVGYTFTAEDLKKIGLPLAVKADQTGGIITWNTIGKNGKSPVINPGALCVNPLSWNNAPEEQPKSKNIYARIQLKNGKYFTIQHFTSARIGKNGGLIIPEPAPAVREKLSLGMGAEVYHGYDYDFFYGNIVENVAERCAAWRMNSSQKIKKSNNIQAH